MADYVPIKEAARRLGVKPKEIRRRIKDGELDGFVRLPSEDGAFGPAAPNRRAAPPPEQDVRAKRLEETVLVLQSELNARRQEVEELHVLLREIKENLPAARASAPPTPAPAPAPESPAAPTTVIAPSEPVIDWNAYDAESEQLRATMSRLESLLEQLESVDAEEEAEPEPEPQPEPVPAPEPIALQPAPPVAAPQAEAAVEPQVEAVVAPPTEPVAAPTAEPPAEPVAAPAVAPGLRAPRAVKHAAVQAAPGPDEPPLGDALNRRRERMGVSREALAAFSRLSWGFITEVEGGRRRDPRSRQRLSAALDAWQKRLNEERKKAS